MEIEHDPPLPPPLSFAYNLSLVKQLTTSKPKHTTMSTKDPSCAVFLDGNVTPNQNLRKHAQQQHKKQVRRRLHTSRPYQERLLNMAEARREIVTALKYHRAAMKQASEEQQQLQHQQQQQQLQHQQQQQQQQSLSLQPSHLSSFDQDGRFKSRRNPRIYPSCTTKISNYMDDFSYSSSFSSNPPPSVPNSYPNPSPVTSPFSHPAPKAENPNLTLPNQTLGLNLNLRHFNNLEAALFLNNNNNNSSLCSYSSPTSSSPPLSIVTDQDVPSIGISQGEGVSSGVDTIESSATIQTSGGLHTAMDDEGMAEIRSLGEQHQMEWNDTISLITSVWWFNCLKNMGHDAREVKTENGIVTCHDNFDEFIKFPTWLNNAHERCLEQCSEDCFQDTTFPW